ncbi:MAG: SRPBCC family protein [Actinomycetota bacterium]
MEYRTEVTIALPRDRVVAHFDDPDNLGKWQDGFVSMEHVSGEYGEAGMVSKLVYETRGRKMELTETIESRNLPDEFIAVYETGGVWNRHVNRFHDEGETTRYVTDTEFRCKGLVRVLMAIRPSMFKKETLKNMERFKAFAEAEG